MRSPAQRRFLDIYGEDPIRIDRTFYKATDCGGHVIFQYDGTIRISTIVEGSDAEYGATIPAGATKADIREAVKTMEDWASKAWNAANTAETVPFVRRIPITPEHRLQDALWVGLCMAMHNGAAFVDIRITRADAMALHGRTRK